MLFGPSPFNDLKRPMFVEADFQVSDKRCLAVELPMQGWERLLDINVQLNVRWRRGGVV
jgi:hypothetical protein